MYGLRVTPNEEVILNKILTETDKIAKVRHLRAIHAIARRNNVDMERAELIYNNNIGIVRNLNRNSASGSYYVGKNGAICEKLSGGACPKIREYPDKDVFINPKKSSSESVFEKFVSKIRAFVKFFKALFI